MNQQIRYKKKINVGLIFLQTFVQRWSTTENNKSDIEVSGAEVHSIWTDKEVGQLFDSGEINYNFQ